MQNSRSKFFVLYVLLLLLGFAVGVSSHSIHPKNEVQHTGNQLKKAITASHNDVQWLDSDAPQISHVGSRLTSKIWSALVFISCFIFLKHIGSKLSALSSALKYPVPFKLLFPEHAFS